MNCSICDRELSVNNDPLSIDCGGECWGCIGEIEAEMGHDPSLDKVRQEFALGLRLNWVDSETGCTHNDVLANPSTGTSHFINRGS